MPTSRLRGACGCKAWSRSDDAPIVVRQVLRAWLSLPLTVRGVAPFVVMAALWWSSSRPPSDASPSAVHSFLHNGMHIVAYAALGGSVLLWLGHSLRTGEVPWRAVVISVVVAVAYGIVDELHQSTVPGRVCSVVDVVSDAMGALLAAALLGHLLGNHRLCRRALPFCILGSLCSVAVATFGPW